jgi:ATP-dependent helicase HepA
LSTAGLAPLLSDLLHGKLDQLKLMEARDSDTDGDLCFIDKGRPDIETGLKHAEGLDEHDPKGDTS